MSGASSLGWMQVLPAGPPPREKPDDTVHKLRQLVVQLSRVYYDQDSELIQELHYELQSASWPEWDELDEEDRWSINLGGADPAA